MARITDDQSDVAPSSKQNPLGYISRFCGIDSVHGLMAQCAILRRLLPRRDVDDRAGLGWIGETDCCI